jgi:hypothetical protein
LMRRDEDLISDEGEFLLPRGIPACG